MRWLKRRKLDAAASPQAVARPSELRSARLLLRPLQADDAECLHALWTAPTLRHFLWNDHILSMEQTRDQVMQSQYLHEQRGFGFWAAFDAEQCMVGFCGYGFFRDEHELELLYGVHAEHWQQGYGREMAEALVAYGLDVLKLREIRASVDAPNRASQRVLERLGFLVDTTRSGGTDKRHYRLPRERRQSGMDGWEAA
ncbi:MAG: GNAT family N-acetyltransferase [Panacagrimonas sp.]